MPGGDSNFDWRSRRLWNGVGYAGSAAWMLMVVVVTNNDPNHPLFDFIFVVPIAGWITGLIAASVLRRMFPRGD